jgi:hypothetical protein
VAGIGAPNPPIAKLPDKPSSTVVMLLDGVVTPQGTIESPQAVRGLWGGLSDLATKTMLTWRCKPALKDHQPVATVVQFEINFRSSRKPWEQGSGQQSACLLELR